MNTFKTICAVGVAALVVAPQLSFSQETLTDRNGTTYLSDYAPPTVSRTAAPNVPLRKRGSRVAPSNRFLSETNVAPSSEDEELLVNQLLGVVLVPNPNDIRPGGWCGVEGVWHDFKDFPPEVGWALQRYLQQPVSLTSLDRMVKDVIVAYREGDRPVVDVVLPEQDITSGVVQLIVVESTLARIRVEGVDVDTEEYIRSQMRVRKGEVIRSSEVLHDLAWVNRSPYRQVDLAYAPGLNFGETDVILKPYDNAGRKSSFYVGYEDSGTAYLGKERFVTGFNMGEFFGNPSQSLAYQFSSDFDFEHVRSHTVAYTKDLPWRHNLTLLASFVDINAVVPTAIAGAPRVSDGFNWGLGTRYNIPLKQKELYICEPMFGSVTRTRDMHFGFDFKSTDNNLEFGGPISPMDTRVEQYQFVAGYQEVWQWRKAVSRFNISGIASLGGFSHHNERDVFNVARAGADPRYAYLAMGLEHHQQLIQDWSLRLSGGAQLSNGSLLASEQFGIGGYDRVRGFDRRIVRGDEGIYTSVEVLAPELSLGRMFNWPHAHGPCADSLQFLAFVDAGAVKNKAPVGNEPDSQSIASTGVGMRWAYNDFFNLRVDYGHPVMTDNVQTDESGRFHIGATATF